LKAIRQIKTAFPRIPILVVEFVQKGIRLRYVGFVSFAASIVGALAGLLFIILVVRRLSSTDLGTWQWINRIVSYALLPAALLNFWSARSIARDSTTSRTALILNGALSLPVLLAYVLLIPLIANAAQTTTPIFLVAAAFIPLYYLNQAMQTIAGSTEPQHIGYSTIFFESSKVLSAFILVFTLQFMLTGAVLSVEIALVIQITFLIVFMRKYLHGRLKRESAKQWVSQSWLSGYLSQSTFLLTLDVVIVLVVSGALGTLVLAYFTVAAVIGGLVGLAGSLATGLYPKLLKSGGARDVEVVLKLLLLFGIPMLVGTMLIVQPLLYLYGSKYLIVNTMTRILVASSFVDTISSIADSVLLGTVNVDRGKPKFKELAKSRLFLIPSINFAMGLCYLVALFFVLTFSISNLSPSASQIGILWVLSLLLVKLPFVSYKLLFAKRVAKFRIPWKAIAKYSIGAAIMAIGLIYCLQFVVYGSFYQFLIYPLGLVGVGVVIYTITLLVIDKDFRQLLRTILRIR
jgi:O-antigen/teichoic acid export membrane protein